MFTAITSHAFKPLYNFILFWPTPTDLPSSQTRYSPTGMFLSITIKMASPDTLMTVTSPTATATATLDALTQHYHGKPNHSDKIVIIGLTVGMVALFLLFIAPCCCMQYLAHRQQRKEQKALARIRAISAARRNTARGNGPATAQV
ncbi:hypothetical protein F25303_10386 [Fusarium sp. NRRL 25303]|nr:hypothetical protein F25303_10386 [Fusarium sp. NRRL 25303]